MGQRTDPQGLWGSEIGVLQGGLGVGEQDQSVAFNQYFLRGSASFSDHKWGTNPVQSLVTESELMSEIKRLFV